MTSSTIDLGLEKSLNYITGTGEPIVYRTRPSDRRHVAEIAQHFMTLIVTDMTFRIRPIHVQCNPLNV